MIKEFELDEKLIKKIENITNTFYKNNGNKLNEDSIYAIIEDLVAHVEYLQEKYEYLERDMQDNYKKISVAEQVD